MLLESLSKADSSLQAKQQLRAEGMYHYIIHVHRLCMHMRILDSRDIVSAER